MIHFRTNSQRERIFFCSALDTLQCQDIINFRLRWDQDQLLLKETWMLYFTIAYHFKVLRLDSHHIIKNSIDTVVIYIYFSQPTNKLS